MLARAVARDGGGAPPEAAGPMARRDQVLQSDAGSEALQALLRRSAMKFNGVLAPPLMSDLNRIIKSGQSFLAYNFSHGSFLSQRQPPTKLLLHMIHVIIKNFGKKSNVKIGL